MGGWKGGWQENRSEEVYEAMLGTSPTSWECSKGFYRILVSVAIDFHALLTLYSTFYFLNYIVFHDSLHIWHLLKKRNSEVWSSLIVMWHTDL